MSNLVKGSSLVLDLSYLQETPSSLAGLIETCTRRAGRQPPLTPSAFKDILETKRFTSKKADCKLVITMYTRAYERKLANKDVLNYQGLGWSDAEACTLAKALSGAPSVREIHLQGNAHISDVGVDALTEALANAEVAPKLTHIYLGQHNRASAEARQSLEDVLKKRRERMKLERLCGGKA